MKAAFQQYQGDRCEVSLDEEFLEHFAFHHVKGNQVVVRLGMVGDGPCRGALTELNIVLELPPAYKSMFIEADKKKNGIIMKDTEHISEEKAVSVEFEKVFKESAPEE